jgi:hypothetical protein
MKTIFLALTLAAPASVFAATPCGVVTRAEASQILGVAAGSRSSPKSDSSRCVIKSAKGGHDTLKIELHTASAEDSEHLRAHTDEERGEEVQSLHDEPWYEVSAVDAAHPNDRRLVIHRDRSVLTLDVHSSHQMNVQTAFENVWAKIADRLPVQK